MKKSRKDKQEKTVDIFTQDFFRTLFENHLSMYFVVELVNDDFVVFLVNKFGAKQLGYKVTELIGQLVNGVIHPDYCEQVIKQLKKCHDNPGKIFNWEFKKVKKDGTEIWVHETVSSSDFQGRRMIMINCEDVTERRLLEKAAKESEKLASDMLNYLPDAAFAVDKNNKVIAWNKEMEKLTGCPANSILGMSDYSHFFYNNADRPMLVSFVLEPNLKLKDSGGKHNNVYQEGDSFVVETKMFSAISSKKYLWAKASPIRDKVGNIIGAVEVIRDISQKKKTEDALRASEQLIKSILDSDPTGLSLTMDRKFTIVNPSFCRIVGYSQEELIGNDTRMMYFNEAEHERVGRKLYSNLTEQRERKIESIWQRKDGLPINVELTINPVDSQDLSKGFTSTVKDITENKRANEILNRTIKQFQTFLDSTDDMAALKEEINGEYRIIMCNEALCRFYELPNEQVIGKTDFDLMPRTAAINCLRTDLQAIERGEVIVSEEIVDNRIYETRKFPVLLQSGKSGVGFFIRDITDKIEAERKKREMEKLLASVNEFSPDATIAIDLEGKVIVWNRAMEEMTGVSAYKMLGKGDYEYALPFYGERRPILIDFVFKDYDEVRKQYNFIDKHGKTLLTETRVPFVRGENRFLWGKASPLLDDNNNIVGAIEVIRDITEHRKLQQTVEESENKFRSLVENTDTIVYIIKGDKLVYVNPAFERHTGYLLTEILTENKNFWEYIHEDCREMAKKNGKARLRGENVPSQYPLCLITKFGGKYFTINATRIQYQGEPAIQGTGINITEQIKKEEENKQLEIRLQQAKVLESVGELAGGAAHDLNNKMGPIVGYSEMIIMISEQKLESLRLAINVLTKEILSDQRLFWVDDSIKKKITNILFDQEAFYEKVSSNVVKIIESAKVATEIIKDMLALARRGVVNRKATNLNKILVNYQELDEYRDLRFDYQDIKFDFHLQDDVLNILGSDDHLMRMIINLVRNAAEAIPNKQGNVCISTHNQYVDKMFIGYTQVIRGDYVVLSVSDDGAGISEEDINKIFNPFFTKKAMGKSGSGMGLTIVWGIIMDHKGYIDVKSRTGENHGTTFTIYLPTTREQEEKKAELESLEKFTGNHETIMIIDDDQGQRELMKTILSHYGYNPTEVESGEKAIELLHNSCVDLLIMDMIMDPGMNGLETYKEIVKICPGQRAIIVSGFSATQNIDEMQKLGAGKYVPKPLTTLTLLKAIREELDKIK